MRVELGAAGLDGLIQVVAHGYVPQNEAHERASGLLVGVPQFVHIFGTVLSLQCVEQNWIQQLRVCLQPQLSEDDEHDILQLGANALGYLLFLPLLAASVHVPHGVVGGDEILRQPTNLTDELVARIARLKLLHTGASRAQPCDFRDAVVARPHLRDFAVAHAAHKRLLGGGNPTAL